MMKVRVMKTWPATKVQLAAIQAGAPAPLTCKPCGEPLKCWCTRHSAGCGCVTDHFLLRLRLNHTLCMGQAGTHPEKYQQLMGELAEHVTGNCETCTFHPALVCSCDKKCPSDFLECDGQPYRVTYAIRCPFHAGAVKRVIMEAAAKA